MLTSPTPPGGLVLLVPHLTIPGLERLQKSMSTYVRWLGRRCDSLEDRDRATPMAYFGRTMATHGEEFDAHSELGNSLVAIGQANERIAVYQESMTEQANGTWAESLERSSAMMKEYQVCLVAVDACKWE